MPSIQTIRDKFPITKSKIYLAHASRGPLPKPVLEGLNEYMTEYTYSGTTTIDVGIKEEGGKPLFARLIGAKPKEIAFIENTSMGLNVAANLPAYPKGSNVVIPDYEYSSVIYPFLKKKGLKIRYVKNVKGRVLIDDIERAVDDHTVAVSISHVHWLNGFRQDLKAMSKIAHEHGALVVVDAIQSAGAIPIDVRRDDIDILATSCYKWLLSPPGCGYLYIKNELIEEYESPFIGWRTTTSGFRDRENLLSSLPKNAGRYEVGTPSLISLMGATAALRLILSTGRGFIEKRILTLTNRLIDGLQNSNIDVKTPLETNHRSGIVNFKIENPKEVVQKLKNRGIIVCGTNPSWAKCSKEFQNTIRVSPHFYNTNEEIDTFIDGLREDASAA